MKNDPYSQLYTIHGSGARLDSQQGLRNKTTPLVKPPLIANLNRAHLFVKKRGSKSMSLLSLWQKIFQIQSNFGQIQAKLVKSQEFWLNFGRNSAWKMVSNPCLQVTVIFPSLLQKTIINLLLLGAKRRKKNQWLKHARLKLCCLHYKKTCNCVWNEYGVLVFPKSGVSLTINALATCATT